MSSHNAVRNGVRYALMVSAVATAIGYVPIAAAQDDDLLAIEEITVTGTRIKVPGVVSSSPIYSVGADEIQLQAQPPEVKCRREQELGSRRIKRVCQTVAEAERSQAEAEDALKRLQHMKDIQTPELDL